MRNRKIQSNSLRRTGLRALVGLLVMLLPVAAISSETEAIPSAPDQVIEEVRSRNPQLAAIDARIQGDFHVHTIHSECSSN